MSKRIKEFITTSFSPKDILKRLDDWRTKIPREELNRSFAQIERETVKSMKSKVPVRTGRLKNSIRIMTKYRKDGGFDLRRKSSVGSSLNYARYVDRGTKPSTGRYVPILGRRIPTGRHPGVRPRNFVLATTIEMNWKIDDIMGKFMDKWSRGLRL